MHEHIRRLKDPTVEFGKQRNPFAPTCPLQFTYSASLLDNTAFAATCMSTSVGWKILLLNSGNRGTLLPQHVHCSSPILPPY
ncbi:hypothetical protein CDAR_65951 [Caerostris darwini]|uniref:Uncharacterized protein n=1 Tax=Caerostris darwini TaxID=1538125 RepID=A0AAV4UC76_9ARAC|nr:hypothetical protein CDAR_65951 [Caerostris darwini]